MDAATHHLILNILFWLAVVLIGIDAYFVLFHAGVPNIRTAPAIRRRIIELLRSDMQARGLAKYTIVDLGSGNGLITREMAKALPEAHVIGVEIAGQSVAWANMMKRREGLNNLEYRKMSFLDFNYAEADAVYMFLIPPALGQIAPKLREQTRPGTLIISNKFRIGSGWEPVEKICVRTLYLHQGYVYIYRAV